MTDPQLHTRFFRIRQRLMIISFVLVSLVHRPETVTLPRSVAAEKADG